jgi:hypothetical protein
MCKREKKGKEKEREREREIFRHTVRIDTKKRIDL